MVAATREHTLAWRVQRRLRVQIRCVCVRGAGGRPPKAQLKATSTPFPDVCGSLLPSPAPGHNELFLPWAFSTPSPGLSRSHLSS